MAKSRKQRGGNSPSAWGYVYNTLGDGWTQFKNSLTLQPGENLGTVQSNDIEPRANLNAQSMQGVPTANDLSLIQRAGKRYRKRKGGNLVPMLSEAAAPLALLGMQQTYKKRTRKGGNLVPILSEAAAPLALLGMQQSYKKRTRKGGNLVPVLSEAAVPLALLGMQQTYKKRSAKRFSKRRFSKRRR